MIDWIKFRIEGRSPKWSKTRKQVLTNTRACFACHTIENLEVHHIIPFRVRPDLELDRSNLIVLCKHCHFTFGHFNDYKTYNDNVFNDALLFSLRVETKKRICD